MAHTDPVTITMIRAQWRRIYNTIANSPDPTPTAVALAREIERTIAVEAVTPREPRQPR